MNIVGHTELSSSQISALLSLWNREYPENLGHTSIADFESYLDGLQEMKHLLLVTDEGEIRGWAFSYTRNGERWFGIILDESVHKQGFGTKMLDHLKKQEIQLNGWVMDHNRDRKNNGSVYVSPLIFYLKNNFFVCPDVRLETQKISAVKIVWNKEQ